MASNITLIRLVLRHPDQFYNQDWYYDEDFAHRVWSTEDSEFKRSATGKVWDYLYGRQVIINGKGKYTHTYYWTIDKDNEGNAIYIGGSSLGRRKGFQIHRYLENPKVEYESNV